MIFLEANPLGPQHLELHSAYRVTKEKDERHRGRHDSHD